LLERFPSDAGDGVGVDELPSANGAAAKTITRTIAVVTA
jgi:hypothetical protein